MSISRGEKEKKMKSKAFEYFMSGVKNKIDDKIKLGNYNWIELKRIYIRDIERSGLLMDERKIAYEFMDKWLEIKRLNIEGGLEKLLF